MSGLRLHDIPYELVPREVPFFLCRTPAGFPSPAQDDMQEPIDLGAWLVQHPAASYIMRVDGQSMSGAGINDGDLIVVNRAKQPRAGAIVVALVHGGRTLKRLRQMDGRHWLVPEAEGYSHILVDEHVEIWGWWWASPARCHEPAGCADRLQQLLCVLRAGVRRQLDGRAGHRPLQQRRLPSSAVEMIEPQWKGMAVTRSFGTPVTTFDGLMGALSQYALRAGEKLRSHGLVAARLTAFFHTNRHKPERPQYAGSRTVTLHPMTNDSLELIAAARRGAERAWRDGYAYTKAGIMLDDLVAADLRPRTLFEEDTDKRSRLMGVLDEINGRFGRWTAVTASQGFRREWKLRSEMRSPAWTTSIAAVPTVRA